MKLQTALFAFLISSSSVMAVPPLLPGAGTPAHELAFKSRSIDTCAADDLDRLMEESRKPKHANFKNDPFGLKKIHFNMVVMDTNEDGLISEQEIVNYNPRELGFWNKFDTNKDGFVSGSDVRKYIEMQLEAKWRNAFRSLDRNRSGMIEQRDMERAYSAHLDQINIPETIQRYDLNGDGVIDIAEYIEQSRREIASTNLKL
jgi:Ca2+-binding EF-hand superfamily protein